MAKRKELSVQKRAQIIILWQGNSYQDIAEILKVSLGAVQKAIARNRETGVNTDKKRSGRPRKTIQRVDNKIYAISKADRFVLALSRLCLSYALATISCEHFRSSRNNPHYAPRHIIHYYWIGCAEHESNLKKCLPRQKILNWELNHLFHYKISRYQDTYSCKSMQIMSCIQGRSTKITIISKQSICW